MPHSERYKIENLLLVGIIPGPSEPPLNVNTHLEPLIDELNLLFKGVVIESPDFQQSFSKSSITRGLLQIFLQLVKRVALWAMLQSLDAQNV